MMYGFFWYCRECGVLWQDAAGSTCWMCGGVGTQCEDDFVYTASSMSFSDDEVTSEL